MKEIPQTSQAFQTKIVPALVAVEDFFNFEKEKEGFYEKKELGLFEPIKNALIEQMVSIGFDVDDKTIPNSRSEIEKLSKLKTKELEERSYLFKKLKTHARNFFNSYQKRKESADEVADKQSLGDQSSKGVDYYSQTLNQIGFYFDQQNQICDKIISEKKSQKEEMGSGTKILRKLSRSIGRPVGINVENVISQYGNSISGLKEGGQQLMQETEEEIEKEMQESDMLALNLGDLPKPPHNLGSTRASARLSSSLSQGKLPTKPPANKRKTSPNKETPSTKTSIRKDDSKEYKQYFEQTNQLRNGFIEGLKSKKTEIQDIKKDAKNIMSEYRKILSARKKELAKKNPKNRTDRDSNSPGNSRRR